jgi:hypothetical protein
MTSMPNCSKSTARDVRSPEIRHPHVAGLGLQVRDHRTVGRYADAARTWTRKIGRGEHALGREPFSPA